MRFQVSMIDKDEKTFEKTILAGNMEEAKKVGYLQTKITVSKENRIKINFYTLSTKIYYGKK